MALAPNRIAAARVAQGLNQTQLAAQIGVTENTVRRWETGKTGVPDKHKLALSELFGVSVPYLMGWEADGNGNGGEVQAA